MKKYRSLKGHSSQLPAFSLKLFQLIAGKNSL
jgi:hypothetical protein